MGNAPPLAPKPRNTLTAVGGGAGGPASGADVALLQQMEDLKEESRQLKDRNLQMQSQVTTVMQERTTLMNELEQVKANFKQHLSVAHDQRSAVGANSALYEQQLMESKQAHDSTRLELDTLRREMNQRLGDSSQFRSMKAIVSRKSDEIKVLKGHLIQLGYQPPASADDGIELQA